MTLYILIALAVLIAAFMWWRHGSVLRGKRKRDEKILAALDPLVERLSNKETVTQEEIAKLSGQPQYRPMLYKILKHSERLDLFPSEALSLEAQGAGILARWMMHPNELEDAPAEIEIVEKIEREFKNGSGKFLVFRFQMPAGHWAADDGWLLGLAGPFFANDEPYCGIAAGFARVSDKYGERMPADLVDWYILRMSSE